MHGCTSSKRIPMLNLLGKESFLLDTKCSSDLVKRTVFRSLCHHDLRKYINYFIIRIFLSENHFPSLFSFFDIHPLCLRLPWWYIH
jgi:hypothetical protein